MPEYQLLKAISLQGGIIASAPQLSAVSQQGISDGSWNAIVSGEGHTRGFNGFTSVGTSTGSRKMLPVGNNFGGIKDIGGTQGSGNFFQDIGGSRWGIGSGQPHIGGANVSGFVLSTLLQVSVKSSGVYGSPVQAGLSQPSAPEIGIINEVGNITNPVSCKIERRRPSTGARSLASPTSAVISPTANRARVTFPLAQSGQTHWRVYFTFMGFGGQGIHYLCKYQTFTDIPESVVAAGTIDGVVRSLDFNFKDGDLVPVEASYDDYTPPAATHAIRLENVMNLAGCYSDSVTDPTSTSTGTAIAVSKINSYESYIPTHTLYLPEQVTDVLARPIDDFGYVACETSVHAIQYVGFRGDDLPPCTITTILPDIGVQFPHNWASFRGRLLIYTAEGSLLLMNEQGEFEGNFAGPITKIIQNWTPANTIVGFDPKNDLIICASGKTVLCFSLTDRSWRQIWLPDFGVAGSVLSCTTSKRRLYLTVTNAGANTAYSFDTGTATAPLSFCSNYTDAPTGSGLVKDIYEASLSAESGAASPQFAVVINTNLGKTVFRRISVPGGSLVFDDDNSFYQEMVGKRIIIFKDGAGGAGTSFFIGKIAYVDSAALIGVKNLDGSNCVLPTLGGDILMFCGDFADSRQMGSGGRHFSNFFPNVIEARSYQLAAWIKGANNLGNVLTADLFGVTYPSSRATPNNFNINAQPIPK